MTESEAVQRGLGLNNGGLKTERENFLHRVSLAPEPPDHDTVFRALLDENDRLGVEFPRNKQLTRVPGDRRRARFLLDRHVRNGIEGLPENGYEQIGARTGCMNCEKE